MKNINVENSLTGWEIDINQNLQIEKNDKFKLLLNHYPLMGINENGSMIALIRKSHPRKYKEAKTNKYIPLLSIYTSTAWRHFYLPKNLIYENIYINDDIIFIKTNKTVKITTFNRINDYPLFLDQTEENRRLAFECLMTHH